MPSSWCTPSCWPSTPGAPSPTTLPRAATLPPSSSFPSLFCSRNTSSLRPADLLILILLVQDLYPSQSIEEELSPQVLQSRVWGAAGWDAPMG